MMHALNLDDQAAEDALVQLDEHVPAAVEIGRPLIAHTDDDGSVTFVTDDEAMWTVHTGGAVDHMVHVGHAYEITIYRRGRELSRTIATPDE